MQLDEGGSGKSRKELREREMYFTAFIALLLASSSVPRPEAMTRLHKAAAATCGCNNNGLESPHDHITIPKVNLLVTPLHNKG